MYNVQRRQLLMLTVMGYPDIISPEQKNLPDKIPFGQNPPSLSPIAKLYSAMSRDIKAPIYDGALLCVRRYEQPFKWIRKLP